MQLLHAFKNAELGSLEPQVLKLFTLSRQLDIRQSVLHNTYSNLKQEINDLLISEHSKLSWFDRLFPTPLTKLLCEYKKYPFYSQQLQILNKLTTVPEASELYTKVLAIKNVLEKYDKRCVDIETLVTFYELLVSSNSNPTSNVDINPRVYLRYLDICHNYQLITDNLNDLLEKINHLINLYSDTPTNPCYR